MRPRCATSWFPISARASRTRRSPAGVSRSATTSNSTRRCARWRPTRPRWRYPAPTRARSSNSVAQKATRSLSVRCWCASRPMRPRPLHRTAGDRARKPVLVGYGADDEMDTSRRAPVETVARPRAKPPVRKLAAELQVDLAALAPGRARTESSPVRMCLPPRGSRAGLGHGWGARRAGHDGAANGVVA